ncbi:uncharacterized protein LOC141901245 [Tubulanus polymorphus]|uniref:uncharacterized protein LOC141901245 n=1 Tax=Tubulanus polymorphus TaxID=672921 RepID=UPI003DA1F65E
MDPRNSSLAAWDPMAEDYESREFNSYDRGPGRDLPRQIHSVGQENPTLRNGEIKLFIGNVPDELAEDGMRNLFGKFGRVTSCFITKGKDSRKIGFLTYGTLVEAEKAIVGLNGKVIRDFKLSVKVAYSPEERERRRKKAEDEKRFREGLYCTKSGVDNMNDLKADLSDDAGSAKENLIPFNSGIRTNTNYSNSVPRNRYGSSNSNLTVTLNTKPKPETTSPRQVGIGQGFGNVAIGRGISPFQQPGPCINRRLLDRSMQNKRPASSSQISVDGNSTGSLCHKCGEIGTKKCKRCKTPYCSPVCQTADWPSHKSECQLIKNNNEFAENFAQRFDITADESILSSFGLPVESPGPKISGNRCEQSTATNKGRIMASKLTKSTMLNDFQSRVVGFDNVRRFYLSTPEQCEKLDRLTREMNEAYRGSKKLVGAGIYVPESKELVAASYCNVWLRAEVIRVNLNGTFSVRFIDTGRKHELAAKDIMRMQPQFTHLPILTFTCGLSDVRPVLEMNSQVEKFLFNQEFMCNLLSELSEIYVVKLSGRDGTDVRLHLEKNGMVSHSSNREENRKSGVASSHQYDRRQTGQNQHTTNLRENRRSAVADSSNQNEHFSVGSSIKQRAVNDRVEMAIFERRDVGNNGTLGEKKTMKYLTERMQRGEDVVLLVVYIKGKQIYAHWDCEYVKTELVPKVIGNMQQKYIMSHQAPGARFAVSDLVAAKSSDGTWYRGQVKAINNNQFVVEFIDFGNSELISGEQIRPLDDEDTSLPIMAVLVEVKGLKDGANLESLNDQTLVGKLHEKRNDCVIFDDLMIVESKRTVKQQFGVAPAAVKEFKTCVADLMLGSEITLVVAHIEDQKIYAQLPTSDNIARYSIIQENLNKLNDLPSSNQDRYTVGDLVAAKSSDGSWYRGQVKAVNKNALIVEFVDFGNSEQVSCELVRPLDAEDASVPKMAVLVEVKGLKDGANLASLNNQKLFGKLLEKRDNCMIFDDLMIEDSNRTVKQQFGAAALPAVKSSPPIPLTVVKKEFMSFVDDMELGSELTVVVVYVEGQKMFAQYFEENVVYQYMMLQESLIQFETTPPPATHIRFTVGDLVAAKSSDGVWYRGQVKAVDNNQFVVEFIDFGNSELISRELIRPLDDEDASFPKLAVLVEVKGLKAGANLDCLKDQTLVGKLLEKRDNCVIFDDLTIAESNRTVKQQFGVALKPSSPIPVTVVKKEFKSLVDDMEPGSELNVVVVYVEGQKIFAQWIQENVVHQYMKLQESLYQFESTPPSANHIRFTVGDLVAAKSSDGGWYRGQVKAVDNNQFVIEFVDFGNSEQISRDLIRPLDDEDASLPKMAVLIEVKGLTGGANLDCLKDQTLVGKLLEKRDNCVIFDDLTIAESNRTVKQQFGAAPASVKSYPPLPLTVVKKEFKSFVDDMELGSELTVVVAYIEGQKIFAQYYENNIVTQYIKLRESLAQFETTPPPANHIRFTVGDLVAAKSSDGAWCRGQVKEIGNNQFVVEFVDFGNSEQVSCELIRPLDDEDASLPKMAVLVEVKGLKDGVHLECLNEQVLIGTLLEKRDNCVIFDDLAISQQELTVKQLVENIPVVESPPVAESSTNKRSKLKYYCDELEIGDKIEGVLLSFVNPDDFYVFNVNAQFLKEMGEYTEELTQYCNQLKTDPQFRPSVGTLVAARDVGSNTDDWYRVVVQEITRDGFVVFFIDFCWKKPVLLADIRPLSDKLHDSRCFAIPCQLVGVKPNNAESWDGVNFLDVNIAAENGLDVTVAARQPDGRLLVDCPGMKKLILDQKLAISCDRGNELKAPPYVRCQEGNNESEGQHTGIQQYTEVYAVSGAHTLAAVIWVEYPPLFGPHYIVIQPENSQLNTEFVEQQRKLSEMYGNLPQNTEYHPNIGDYVAVQYGQLSEITWNRGVVKEITENTMNVHFIDFGNYKEVDVSMLHPLAPSFYKLPMRSARLGIRDTKPVSQWTAEMHGRLVEILAGTCETFTIERASQEPDVCWVDFIYDGNKSLRQKLIDEGIVAASVDGSLENLKETDRLKANQGQEMKLPPGLNEVVVIDCKNPDEFYIQLNNQTLIDRFRGINTSIFEHCTSTAGPYTPVIGELVGAMFMEDWCRAIVLAGAPEPGYFNVKYLDFGNESIVSEKNIRPASRAFLDEPYFGIRCSLAGIHEQAQPWPKEIIDSFREMLLGNLNEKITVESVTGNNVTVYHGNDSVNLKLQLALGVENAPALIPSRVTLKDIAKPPVPTVMPFEVRIINIESPATIYVTTEALVSNSNQIVEHLTERITKMPSTRSYKPMVGDMCAALNTGAETLWNRAELQDISPDGEYTVFYIDYAYQEKLPLTHLKPLPNEFLKQPLGYYQVKLSGIEAPTGGWNSDAVLLILKHSQEASLKVTCIVETEAANSLDVTMTVNGQSLSDLLVQKDLATPSVLSDEEDDIDRQIAVRMAQLEELKQRKLRKLAN